MSSSFIDLFVLAGEASGDYKGARLIEELLKSQPNLRIAAIAGPHMRKLPIKTVLPMEKFQVMGFSGVVSSLPKLIYLFFFIRNLILKKNPKAVVCIDYPGFHLRLEQSLRKKGFLGKLIHYACPTVWAWGKNRIPKMEKSLDLLISLFPFEKKYFEKTSLNVAYVGHPLSFDIPPPTSFSREKILAIFPGSRSSEIEGNLSIQIDTAKKLLSQDPSTQIHISISHEEHEQRIRKIIRELPCTFVYPKDRYALMKKAHLAIAKSGTITLELALHQTPTIVNFAIRSFDVFLAQKIFRIRLPFYCIVNIIGENEIFPEFFGPNLTPDALFKAALFMWSDEKKRNQCIIDCQKIRQMLHQGNPSQIAAQRILDLFSRSQTLYVNKFLESKNTR